MERIIRTAVLALALAGVATACQVPNGNGCHFLVGEDWAAMDYQNRHDGTPPRWVTDNGAGEVVGYSWVEDAATDTDPFTNVWTTVNCTYSNGATNTRPAPTGKPVKPIDPANA